MNHQIASRPSNADLTISTSQLLITPLCKEHLISILKWKNQAELSYALMLHHSPVTESEVLSWFQKNQQDPNQILLIVQNHDGSNNLGLFRFMFIDWISGTSEVAIFFGEKDARGRGLGTELLTSMLELARKKIGLRKLVLRVSSENSAALSLYKRCGFVMEGTQRKQFWNGKTYEDTIWMGVILSDSF